MSSNTTLKGRSDLLDALLVPEAEKHVADMRWISNASGVVYEAQVLQLQKLSKLVFEPAIAVISISQENRYVRVESSGKPTLLTSRYPEMVKFILGGEWTIQMCYDVKHAIAETRKKRSPVGGTRKGSAGGIRKKRRVSAKPKNKR